MKRLVEMLSSHNPEDCIFVVNMLLNKGYSRDRIIKFLRKVRSHNNIDMMFLLGDIPNNIIAIRKSFKKDDLLRRDEVYHITINCA